MKTRSRFQKLGVWQEARKFNREIYRISRRFPQSEVYGITSQIRRASVSVSSNIAEGSGRNSDADFAHYLEQAYASAMEVASLCFLASDEGYISETDTDRLMDDLELLAKRTAALNRSLLVKRSKTPFARARSARKPRIVTSPRPSTPPSALWPSTLDPRPRSRASGPRRSTLDPRLP